MKYVVSVSFIYCALKNGVVYFARPCASVLHVSSYITFNMPTRIAVGMYIHLHNGVSERR